MRYWVIFLLIINIFSEGTYNYFTVSCKKSRITSLISLIRKKIVVFLARFAFLVKLIYWIVFGSACIAWFLFRSISVSLLLSLKYDKMKQATINIFITFTCAKFFKWFDIFLCHFLLANQKSCDDQFLLCSILFLQLEESIFYDFF